MGRHSAVLAIGMAWGALVLAGCGDDTGTTSTEEPEPTVVVVVVVEPVALAGADSGVDISEVRDELPANTGRRTLPTTVGDLDVWNDKVVDLADGRSLVLGRWSPDDPLESWSRPRTTEGVADRVVRSDRPIRLFVVDWETEAVTPISVAVPESHVFSNATGEHFFHEVVLEFEVDPDEATVRYTAGWNGAGYDSPYSLWRAAIPPG